MITLNTLKWGHAFSYGDNNVLHLDKNTLTQLLGANGHGKSSIALVLEEVIYNKNSKGIKKSDILNRYSSAKAYWIELVFHKHLHKYKIITNRGSTQTVKLFKDDEDISAHTSTATYKMIEDIMGMDHKTFSQLIYQSSVSSLEFLTAPDTARKKFLIDLLNLEAYSRAGELFKEEGAKTTKELEALVVQINTIKSWIKKFDVANKKELELKKLLDEPTDLRVQLRELEGKLSNINQLNKAITTNNLYKQQLEAIVLDTTNYSQYSQDKLRELEVGLTINKGKLDSANKLLKELRKFKSSTCITCGQTLPKDTSNIDQIALLEENINAYTAEVNSFLLAATDLKAKLLLKTKAEEAFSNWEKYNSLYRSDLGSELHVASDIAAEILEVAKAIKAIELAIKEAVLYNNKAAAHNAEILLLRKQEQEMLEDLVELDKSVNILTKKLNNQKLLIKTFSNTGLVAYKIECKIKELEILTNEYLAELCDGRFQLSFQINSSDKLNVVINDNGADIDIFALSSGERARVNVATLLAIRKLMQSISGSRVNLLILDETISNLDIEGKEKLIEVLLNETELNTILVSHEFTHPLLEKINIFKSNNISRIVE